MKLHFQGRRPGNRIGKLRRKASPEVIMVGLLPQGGGMEMLSWAIHKVARSGDVVICLIVCHPFSTFTIVGKTENGVEGKGKQMQLGELRKVCKQKQIEIDVKFAVGDNSEKILIEQASALGASTLIIGTSDRSAHLRRRSISSYCIGNAPAGCSVISVRNGKILHYKDNPLEVPHESNTISSIEGMLLLHPKQSLEEASVSVTRDINRKGESKNWFKQTNQSTPRGIFEGSYLCLDSDSSFSSSSSSSSDSFSKKALLTSDWDIKNGDKGFQWRSFLHLWKHRSMRRLSTFPWRVVPRNLVTSSPSIANPINKMSFNPPICRQIFSSNKDSIASSTDPCWKCFTFKELESATNSFSSENFIGEGGYAEVYKASLADGQIVAVKRLTRGQTEDQRVDDFLTELGIMAHIDHPNTTHLIGFGIEGGLHLVFEFSPHGSLASLLHGPNSQALEWDIRYRVAVGTAQGLLYLHEGCRRRIIHRDIKASNILLTKDFEPQISDFGLAKWLPKEWTHRTITPIEGTFGYLAPEYFMYGIVDEKTDVFSFGVLLLELITGRLPVNSAQQSLVIWARPLLEGRNIQELVDPRLADAYDVHQMNFMVLTAALCIQQAAILRPPMHHVLQLLKGEGKNLEYSEPWTMPFLDPPYLLEHLDADEYTSTRYQNDLNRHREVALEL